jgi:alpha-mannosidase
MPYQELLILLPCHSLEDFPTYHEGDDAQSLLASWSALWHPELIASAGKMPKWQRIEDVPQEVSQRLIVVPTVCVSRLPTGFAQRVKEEGGCLVRKTVDRAEIVAAALAGLGGRSENLDPELAADFLALGYCYLQVQLLTRQMRYSSNLDEVYFGSQLVAAAQAAVVGDQATAREKLSACFNVLAEERDHYYPVDAFVLDLNLLATTTLGSDLRSELANEAPINVLLSAGLLKEMETREPATLAALRDRVTAGNVGLIGGEEVERRLPLLSLETILAELNRGLAVYESLLGKRPEVYGRWRFGLSPMLPALLFKLGFRGAIHAGFEEGKTPDGLQFKVRWEGLDGSAIDAISRSPLDATKPQTFLTYATKMGESMDSDHVATLALAHWPGQASVWLGDLRRISKYCHALGKFVTVDQFFKQTEQPGQIDRFEADRYKSPYLKQAVIRKQDDPISTSVRYWKQQAIATAEQAMRTLATLVLNDPITDAASNRLSSGDIVEETTELGADAGVDGVLGEQFSAARDRLGGCLAGSATGPNVRGTGELVLNPASHVRRLGVDISSLKGLPAVAKPIYAAAESATAKYAVADVPGGGFVWISAADRPTRDAKPLLLAEDGVLRNEFFEAVISTTTGTLAAVHEYKSRGNRMSQQLAFRMPGAKQKPGETFRDPDETAIYSVMAADDVLTTVSTTAMGEVVARGRLLDLNGHELAAFQQTYRIWRGSRVLEVEVELDPHEEPRADPWNSYFCARFAWADESAELFRTIHQTRQPATVKQFEAPHYIDIVSTKNNTTILTGGLPFHRRHEFRMLDSLLITRGERQRKFKFGIGVDLTHPLHDALALLTPKATVQTAAPSTGAAGWLLHIDARNVIATACEPLVEGGSVVGFKMRLLETVGRGAKTTLSCFRSIRSAEKVDPAGQSIGRCEIEDGKARVDIAAHEWVEVAARF